MIVTSRSTHFIRIIAAVACAFVAAWSLPALSQQSTTPLPPTPPPAQRMVLIPPPAAIQFQQSVQQQQVQSQLQQRQLESDLHRSVTNQSMRPLDAASPNRTQLEQAAQAQSARDQAAQQNLVNQYWGAGAAQPPSRVQPARARSGQ